MLLPGDADEVEIIEALRITDPRGSHGWTSVPGEVLELWDGEQAGEALALIAELPEGKQQRCFLPRFGIRAHSATEPLFEIAFCFRCEGALVVQSDSVKRRSYVVTFDPDSVPSQELLRRFRAAGT